MYAMEHTYSTTRVTTSPTLSKKYNDCQEYKILCYVHSKCPIPIDKEFEEILDDIC